MSEEKLVKNFVDTVIANGHTYLFPRIVRSFARKIAREEAKETITVSSAKELSQNDVAALLKREPYKHALSPKHRKVVRKTDETLIGGVVVRTGVLRLDSSYKRALQDLYHSLTST